MILRSDITGRKYVCLGLIEKAAPGWAVWFEIGKQYYEVVNNEFDKVNLLVEKDILYLYNAEADKRLFVDAIEFNEVDKESYQFRKLIIDSMFSLN